MVIQKTGRAGGFNERGRSKVTLGGGSGSRLAAPVVYVARRPVIYIGSP